MIIIIITLLSGYLFSIAEAGTPPIIPSTPTPVPQQPSAGSSPSSSEPITFQSYSLPLLSSDGSVIGNVTGIDFNTARLLAASNVSLNDDNYSLIISEDLNQRPVDPVMDITLENDWNLPKGMSGATPLISASIARKSGYGWPVKPWTLNMTFSIPFSRLNGSSVDDVFYLVRYDGAGYQYVKANLIDNNDPVIFQASPPDDAGVFTLVMVRPLPVPMSFQTLTPAPDAAKVTTEHSQTPGSFIGDVIINYSMWIVMLINGVAIGIVTMLILTTLNRL